MTLCGTEDDRKKIIARLNRIEGQVRGLRRMVEEDRDCFSVLKQVASTTGAMKSLCMVILEGHLTGCVSDAIRDKNSGGEMIKQVISLFNKFGT